ncbi:MAG: hypothetical protein NT126_07745 [Bacteroidetes bacterium]|nr:hypothetical protein [Bacteroidota bacterium]
MKKAILTIAVLGITFFVQAQHVDESKVPAAVKKALYQKYPDQSDVKWEKEKGKYEASFNAAGIPTSVLINSTGSILEFEFVVSENELPREIFDYLSNTEPKQAIKKASIIKDAAGNKMFEAEVNGNDYIFDSNGKFIRKEKEI